jgi:hypothetical protein
MKKITLTQDAYANGGSVRAGANSIYELTAWYEAAAEDTDGNVYRVIWAISDDYNPAEQDESDACDWSTPWAILDKHYSNVSDTVTLDCGK